MRLRPRLTAAAGLSCALSLALMSPSLGAAGAANAGTPLPPGLARLVADGTPSGRAIVELRGVPSQATTVALKDLGLRVQPMTSLPLAVVKGPVAAMRLAVTTGLAKDVYPDERVHLLDTASSNAIGAGALRAKGFTGKGVTVGVVDSGCDATQPDLADHVVHNVSLYSPEYANQKPDGSTTLVVPVDKGPYSNTDIAGGHGTHVAGIVAADSTSVDDGSRYGVAPDAKLACFSIGEVLFTTAVVTAYDYILSQPKMLGIDVLNNSWGNSYRQFDPNDPVAVATKAVADKGVTVVFASGNSGAGDSQASLNPFSQSPWVISVAAGTLDRRRGDFSSNGLVDDNSKPVGIGADGHTVFTGDRIGLVHPDVTAPGVDISSTCNPTGTVIGQCPPGSNTTASGTSMAAPHIAGAAAVLLQARPALSPAQVRQALEATATRVLGPDKKPLPFWEVGFGYVNLDRAVALVRRSDWRSALATASRKADARVGAADGRTVERTDIWTYPAPPVTFQGSDSHTYRVKVSDTADQLRVTVVHPSLGTVGANFCSYTATVKAPNGRVVGTTTDDQLQGSGTAVGLFPVRPAGTYTVTITGDYAGSDPDTIDSDSVLGRVVLTHVAQLHHS